MQHRLITHISRCTRVADVRRLRVHQVNYCHVVLGANSVARRDKAPHIVLSKNNALAVRNFFYGRYAVVSTDFVEEHGLDTSQSVEYERPVSAGVSIDFAHGSEQILARLDGVDAVDLDAAGHAFTLRENKKRLVELRRKERLARSGLAMNSKDWRRLRFLLHDFHLIVALLMIGIPSHPIACMARTAFLNLSGTVRSVRLHDVHLMQPSMTSPQVIATAKDGSDDHAFSLRLAGSNMRPGMSAAAIAAVRDGKKKKCPSLVDGYVALLMSITSS
jgi:hypothetical protein